MQSNIDINTARIQFYSKIKRAFEHLEYEVKTGRIKSYGICSNA